MTLRQEHRSEYHSWNGMKSRCYCKSDNSYSRYGASGIEVCPRWRYSFAAFMSDMGPKPSPAHSIDRINNDGNYEPLNCRWATLIEQQSNRRFCRSYIVGGVPMTLATAWRQCALPGITYSALLKRVVDRGWNIEQALRTPLTRARVARYALDGTAISMSEMSRLLAISNSTLDERLFKARRSL